MSAVATAIDEAGYTYNARLAVEVEDGNRMHRARLYPIPSMANCDNGIDKDNSGNGQYPHKSYYQQLESPHVYSAIAAPKDVASYVYTTLRRKECDYVNTICRYKEYIRDTRNDIDDRPVFVLPNSPVRPSSRLPAWDSVKYEEDWAIT